MASKAQFPMEQSVAGEFKRQDDGFRGWVTADGRSGYPAAEAISSLRILGLSVGSSDDYCPLAQEAGTGHRHDRRRSHP